MLPRPPAKCIPFDPEIEFHRCGAGFRVAERVYALTGLSYDAANAFFDATGVRMRRVPLTPERVRAAPAKA